MKWQELFYIFERIFLIKIEKKKIFFFKWMFYKICFKLFLLKKIWIKPYLQALNLHESVFSGNQLPDDSLLKQTDKLAISYRSYSVLTVFRYVVSKWHQDWITIIYNRHCGYKLFCLSYVKFYVTVGKCACHRHIF